MERDRMYNKCKLYKQTTQKYITMLQTTPVVKDVSAEAEKLMLDQLKLQNTKSTELPIGEYIFQRILQLGIKSIFGVPGDFNLRWLEQIYNVKGLNWIGCCNELNASYAADSYAKTSQNIGVVLTTYGVGELSALNGIAGAYTEYAPVLHLVGTSAMKFKKNPKAVNLHHLAGDAKNYKKGDHYKYERIAAEFACDTASIEEDVEEACDMIDRVILNVWRNSRPGYIFLPCDLTGMMVDSRRLNQPIELSYSSLSSTSKIDACVDKIINLMYKSKNMSVLADDFIRKFRMEGEFSEFLDKLDNKVNLYSTMGSKGIIDEINNPRYVGTYFGKYEKPVAALIESSDLVLHIGKFDHELNVGAFSFNLKEEELVIIAPQYVQIGSEFDESLTMMEVLPALIKKLESSKINTAPIHEQPAKYYELENAEPRVAALQEVDLIKSLNQNLKEDDVLIVETCSFLFAVPDLKVRKSKLILQCYWASIGYALPATLGASLALRDYNLPGKVVSIEGDGSAQMSLQELSSMLRYDINATLIILNNSGYTIERVIMGPYSSYNDINSNWQWTDMLRCFGDVSKEKSESHKVTTPSELDNVLGDSSIVNNNKFKLFELILPMFDVPQKLQKFVSGG